MKLHEYMDEFKGLIAVVAEQMHLPEAAIERDYYIVLLLQKLADSEYADKCVFKGGTSLSKCYPGSIERFSEDIDLTFLGMELPNKVCDKTIKSIEKVMTEGANTEKIGDERSDRSKSMFVWFGDKANRVKLEIGSSVKPDPYSKRTLKTYIQEFLEANNGTEDIEKYELKEITLNVLDITRTFIDKLFSVKRHALCGNLTKKVRHIYDVVRLYRLPEIQSFIANKEEFKGLIKTTKETDTYYLAKRVGIRDYDPTQPYNFGVWKHLMDDAVRNIYESLHKELLYTDEQQNFDDALRVFEEVNAILAEIGE